MFICMLLCHSVSYDFRILNSVSYDFRMSNSISYDFRMLTLIFHLFSAKSWYARCSYNDNRGTYLHTVFKYKATSYVHSIHTNVDTNVDTRNYSYKDMMYVASEVLAG